MAQLPLVNARSVQTSREVPGYQQVEYHPDAFGAGIGRALKELGQTGQEFAMTTRALKEDVKANSALEYTNKADDELRQWMYDPQDGILAKTGGNAIGSGGQIEAVTRDIRQRYLASITDPDVKEAFDKRFMSSINQAKDVTARHELGQVSEYKAQTTQATLAQATLDAYNGYTDETSLAKAREKALTVIRANTIGAPAEQVAVAEAQAVSQLHMAVVARWAEEDPNKALDYVERHKDEISGPDIVNATKLIQPALQMRQADEWVAGRMNAGSAPAGSIYSAIEDAESSGNAGAVSGKGALGLMQLMPGTAKEVAARIGRADIAMLDDDELERRLLEDPDLNRELGRTYFDQQLKRYGGDVEAALVAYNGGPGAGDAFLRHNAGRRPGDRDYTVPGWKGIKNESEAYVKKVLGTYSGGAGAAGRASGRMTPENWGLKNFRPEDILAPTAAGQWVDARAATGLDQLADRMTARFPGFKIKINEERAADGTTAGRRRGTSDPNDNPHVKNSQHIHGTAFDVQVQGWSDDQKAAFLSEARSLGFSGIGFYGPDGHLHIDMGGQRTWGAMPEWAKTAMQVPVGRVEGAPASSPGSGILGTGGTGQTAGGPGAFYVDPALADFTRMQAEALAIPDSSVRTLALQKISILEATAKGAQAEREGAAKQSAWDVLVQGGSVSDLGPADLAQLEPSFVSSLYAYESNRASGKLTTDWKAFTEFKQLSNEEMVAMGVNVYEKYRPITADSEFKEILNMQEAAKKALAGDQASINLLANTRTSTQMIGDAVAAMGWKSGNKAQAVKINDFSRKLDDRVRAEQMASGKELPPEKVQDIIDKLLIEGTEPGMLLNSSSRAMETETPENFFAVDDWDTIQLDDQKTLLSAYRTFHNGEEPDRAKATGLYNLAMQVWLGADPTIPEDDIPWMQDRAQKYFGHPLSDDKLKEYYAGYLLTLLGSSVRVPRP